MTKDKNDKEAGKKQKENPAGCAWKAKATNQRNEGEEKRTVDSAKFEFYDEIMIKRCDGREGNFRGGGGRKEGRKQEQGWEGKREACDSSEFLNF